MSRSHGSPSDPVVDPASDGLASGFFPAGEHQLAGLESAAASPSGLAREIRAQKSGLETLIREGASGEQVGHAYSALYDRLLSRLFHDVLRGAANDPPVVELAAAGSYGRRTLAPRSDLDVRILCESEQRLTALCESLLYPLWDAGIDVGHQVVSVGHLTDLALEDVCTATCLLDWRVIVGGTRLGAELESAAHARVFSGQALRAFIDALETRTIARHERFGDSVYLLEPNLKSGAGGLRDLDVIHWLARARFRVDGIGQLAEAGVLSERELHQLLVAREFIMSLRNAMHLGMRRASDHLSYERQEEMARALGYGTSLTAPERLMRDYYCQARVVALSTEMMISRCRARQRSVVGSVSIGHGMSVGVGTVWLDEPEMLEERPTAALRLYWEAVEGDLQVSQISREAIRRGMLRPDVARRLREDPASAPLFLDLICAARTTRLARGSVLTDLHDVGLLTAMIPEFLPLVGRVHRDAYHVHTVDVHSIAALDFLHSLRRGERTDEHRLACRVAAEAARVRVLCLATLLHDVGKCGGGVGHAGRGAEMAGPILARLGLSRAESHSVEQLIRTHLRMYHIATRLDVENEETVRSLAFAVGDDECLRELYLLTVSDVTTTSPTSMTSWKRQVIDDLFRATLRHFRGLPARWSQAPDAAREVVLARCAGPGERRQVQRFLRDAPARYLHAFSPRSILSHARFVRSAAGQAARIELGRRRGDYAELWVAADDHDGVLLRIAAAVHVNRASVLRADVYAWCDERGARRCFDIVWVRGLFGRRPVEERVASIERTLGDLMGLGGEALARRVESAREEQWERPEPRIMSEVHVDNRTASEHTVVEVIVRDRPLLLYSIAAVFEQLGVVVSSAKINTEGPRAIDVFCVRNAQGDKLTRAQAVAVERNLAEVLALDENAERCRVVGAS